MSKIRLASSVTIFALTFFFILSGLSASYASDQFYTIQAGTYFSNGLPFAEKLYSDLMKKIDPSMLESLRIERTPKFYIVRIGNFSDHAEARELFEEVKKLVPDAFILKLSKPSDFLIVKSYGKEETLQTGRLTVDTGSFAEMKDAEGLMITLMRSLQAGPRDTLRVEKMASSYHVRVGYFEDRKAAEEFLKKNSGILQGALIARDSGKEASIVLRVRDMDPSSTAKAPSLPVPSSAPAIRAETQEKKQQSSVDELIGSVSSQYANEDYEKAAELLKKGIARWPNDPTLYAWYGATLLNLSSPDKAYEQYKKASELSPDVPDFQSGMGFSLMSSYVDKVKGSIEAFQKALELDPNNAAALEGLGTVYISIGKRSEAQDIYRQLVNIDADSAKRLNDLITKGVDWSR